MTSAAGMPCPVCRVSLVMSERQGVEIDYCPKCRGVWLDRGELDKIIERSAAAQPVVQPMPQQAYDMPRGHEQTYRDRPQPGHREDDDRHRYDPRYRKKKESFLGDLFDF